MKKMFFKALVVCFFAVLYSQAFVFADSYVRVRLTSNQPSETTVYGKEIAPFSRFSMKPITSKKELVILENITLQVENFDEISSAVNKFVLILDKSKGVDRVNENRVIAEGSYGGGDYITLYSLHGSNIFSFENLVKMKVSLVMNDNLDTFPGEDLSFLIRSFYAIWINGSYATIKGYLPMKSVTKAISNDPGSGIAIANELETPYGTLKYEVPEVSSESVIFRKIFIYGKKKGLKLLVQVDGEESREFRCRHNSYITSCDLGKNGIVVPKGSTITITSSEQGIFYQGFETLDVFCEGEQSGRRIFVSPLFSNGKG